MSFINLYIRRYICLIHIYIVGSPHHPTPTPTLNPSPPIHPPPPAS